MYQTSAAMNVLSLSFMFITKKKKKKKKGRKEGDVEKSDEVAIIQKQVTTYIDLEKRPTRNTIN
jgi:hypothetical protein